MQGADVLRTLAAARGDKAAVARAVAARPGLVETLLAGVADPRARVRFGSARVLEMVAEQSPGTLYPQFDFFVRLLAHENRILQWEATRILARLVAVDQAGQFARVFRRFFAPIRGPVMITAANIIGCAPVIARARPVWADRIARQVLEVERANYATAECRNVASGHAVQACAKLLPFLKKPKAVLEFVRRQLHNPRPATRRKAETMLKRAGYGLTNDD